MQTPRRILKMVLRGILGRSPASRFELTGGNSTYPLAFDRSERFKRSLVCTSSALKLPTALPKNHFEHPQN
jgi:hypothetical protein